VILSETSSHGKIPTETSITGTKIAILNQYLALESMIVECHQQTSTVEFITHRTPFIAADGDAVPQGISESSRVL